MKKFTSTSLAAALALCGVSFAFAQDAPALPEPVAPAEPVPFLDGLSQRIKSAVAQFKLAQVQPLEVERDALAQAKAALDAVVADQATTAFDQAKSAFDAVAADTDVGLAIAQSAVEPYVARIFGRAPARSLVIHSSKADRSEQAEIEEDLTVMAHLFEKAIRQAGAGGSRDMKAMGINVYSLMPGSQPIQSLYLEGYGALFLMNTKFPLVAPPARKEESKTEEPRDSAWNDARRELFGPRDGGFFGKTKRDAQPAEEFDADKVNALKDALLESLKNAGNIRHVKPEEFITLTVIGPTSAAGGSAFARVETIWKAERGQATSSDVLRTDGRGDTVMTLRAKKADVDAFAKDKLSLDEFRKKVSIQTYGSSASNSRSAQMLYAPDNVRGTVRRSGAKTKPVAPAEPDAPADKPNLKF